MFLQCFDGVFGATGLETAAALAEAEELDQWGQRPLVNPDGEDQELAKGETWRGALLEAVVSKVFWRLPFELLGVGKVPDPFDVERKEPLERQLVVRVAHDDDDVAGQGEGILVFPKNFLEEPPCTVTLDGVAHPAGSNDADPPRGRILAILDQELEEEIPCLERLPRVRPPGNLAANGDAGNQGTASCQSGGQAFATFPPSCPDDGATRLGGHAGTEAELAGALNFGRSVSGFHRLSLPMGLGSGKWGKGLGGKGLAASCQGLSGSILDFPL